MAFTSIDGQQHSIGESNVPITIQACSNPINYLIALAEHGEEYVRDDCCMKLRRYAI